MFNSWLHFNRVAQELAGLLNGAICGTPFTYQKNHLHIPLEGAGEWHSLHLSLQAPLPFLTLDNSLPQPKHKVSLLRNLTGGIISAVICRENDRQILLILNAGAIRLLFQLYGVNGNVFLFDSDGLITDSFKKIKKSPDCDLTDFQIDRHLFPDQEQFTNLLEKHPDQSVATFLTKSMRPVLPKILVSEICLRGKLDARELLVNLNIIQFDILWKMLNDLANEMRSATIRIYSAEPPVFSLIKLQIMPEKPVAEYDSLIIAQNQFIKTFLDQFRFSEKRKALLRQIELLSAVAQRKLIRQRRDLENLPTADNYREWADALLATRPVVAPFSDSITLPGLTDESRPLTIPLDPKFNPIKNAQRYYQKARQIETSRSELIKNIAETEQQIRQYENLRLQISDATEFKSLRSLASQLPITPLSIGSVENQHQPFKSLIIDNREILIGKSARDNDELLHKFARPHDFWLHAQGTTGSHVVVRNPGKVPTLPRKTLEKVAGLAAFHSKAKHSTVVPVIFTQCKYVSKPRHSAPGTVTVKFEKTLIVEPLDPKKYY